MILYVAFQNLKLFYLSNRKVFVWMIISLTLSSFILCYAYSFARYRGKVYEHSAGSDIARYRIECSSIVSEDAFQKLKDGLDHGFPDIDLIQCFSTTNDGYSLCGTTEISMSSGEYTGLWKEGYYIEYIDSEERVCAVNDKLLSYGDRLKMSGTSYSVNGIDYTIRGVYEKTPDAPGVKKQVDIVIPLTCFWKDGFAADTIWIVFQNRMTDRQLERFRKVLTDTIGESNLILPPVPGEDGAFVTNLNMIQYSMIYIMLVVCLVFLIRYFQQVNLSTYTIYWITGARKTILMLSSILELLILCVTTFLAGGFLNWAFRFLIVQSEALTMTDLLLGFGIYLFVFVIFGTSQMRQICNHFQLSNIRRDE